MRAYYYNENTNEDQRGAHEYTPSRPVTVEQLEQVGVLYWHLNDSDRMEQLETICKEREYKNRDEITISPERLPDYPTKIKTFFTEHLHEDEEIRFILDGSGYFDVRDKNDEWIRIFTERNDLIVLPAGIYHRFTLDEHDFIHVMRLFKDEPKWIAVNRPADDNSTRLTYLQTLSVS
ncbi:1,2-dihydroxy-3-keto-5-methylthiopentene dioxygenase 3 [Syncephalis plumigaleata]|nr:1,2-dihydroxy-3-keto-5-methylthiopentene dioxygenase 3 [Syncephalis plumigaleata]